MPELPEVETVRRALAEASVGRTISNVRVYQPKLRWPVTSDLATILAGAAITSITRQGKYLLFNSTQAGGSLIMHLGMSGVCRILPTDRAVQKHDHVVLDFDNDTSLFYNDPRRFGAVLWSDDPQEHRLLKLLGCEPLTDDFNAEFILQRIKNKKCPIKQWLMNGREVVGIGNIYASEVLFRAGVNPATCAHQINAKQAHAIACAAKHVLTQAITAGGTTFRDFRQTDGKPGYFSQQLAVYGRAGQPCPSCQLPIAQVRMSNRSTFYCPSCQS